MRPARYERGLRRVASVASATILTFVHLLYATIRQNSVFAEPHFRLEDHSDGCGVHCDGSMLNDFQPCFCGLSDYSLWCPLIPAFFVSRPMWFSLWFAVKTPLRTAENKHANVAPGIEVDVGV